MSTDHRKELHAGENEPRHADVSFEKQDVVVRSIYWYLLALGISVAAAFFVSIYILKFTTHYVQQGDTPMAPSRAALGRNYRTMPPEPRLQGVPGHETDPQQDRRDKVKEDTAANEKYGWVNEQEHVAQIPVSEAMKIIAEKGLGASGAAEKKK